MVVVAGGGSGHGRRIVVVAGEGDGRGRSVIIVGEVVVVVGRVEVVVGGRWSSSDCGPRILERCCQVRLLVNSSQFTVRHSGF